MQNSGQGPVGRYNVKFKGFTAGPKEKEAKERIHWNQKRKGQKKRRANAVTETDSSMFDLPTDKELTAK